jgi:hypothetical protein
LIARLKEPRMVEAMKKSGHEAGEKNFKKRWKK